MNGANRNSKGLPRGVWIAAIVVVAGIAAVWFSGRGKSTKETTTLTYAAIERKDISLTVEATGTVEPIDLVEVKSKASGQIIAMPVEIGSTVRVGELLAQIDTRDVKNQYEQSLASLRAAEARSNISAAQKKRADELYAEKVITTQELETAQLDEANSRASLIAARTNLDLAKQRLEDATVSAPIAGTVLSQAVAVGQVIASATSSVSGGTTLLTMADLSRIRMRALVSESDIGNVRPGQSATVTVDAFPNRPFEGRVEKIEPQAVVQQSVTMFPVLISLANEDGLLLPGMNGEVSVQVQQRENVVVVPVDAVRTVRELPALATTLGLPIDSLRASVERQTSALRVARAGGGGGRDSSRWRGMSEAQRDSMRTMRRRMGGGGGGGGGGGTAAAATGPSGGGGAAAAAGGAAGTGMRGGRGQVVFVQSAKGLEVRVIRTGIGDFDNLEVLAGLNEGEQVALLNVAEAQAARSDVQSRIRQRMGSGMPGVPGGGGRSGARPSGGGGGGGGR